MEKIQLFNSLLYSIFQITQGLLLHPYQTMQSLVKEKVFVWMTLLPTVFLAIVTVLWKFLIVPTVHLVFSCPAFSWPTEQTLFSILSQNPLALVCHSLPFLSNFLTFFCIYWQLILLYLLFRFSRVFLK